MKGTEIINLWDTTNRIIPTKEQIIENPILEYYDEIITEALKKDPTIITIIKTNLKEEYLKIAIEKGIIITKEMLEENPNLTKKQIIMEYAIKSDPSLIKYAECIIKPEIIEKVIETYTPTKEDVKKHPNLLKQTKLIEMTPELEEYIKYFPAVVELKTRLENNEPLNKIKQIGNEKAIIIKELARTIITDEKTNKKEQEEAYSNLMIIIDKIIQIRYKKQKITFKYPDIVTLNDEIVKTYHKINETNIDENLDELAKQINEFIKGKIKKRKIKKQLLKFYKTYIQNKSLTIAETEWFCNKILNIHRDVFINNEKEHIIETLKRQLELTDKKKTEIYIRRKLKIITEQIKQEKITDLQPKMYKLRDEFKKNKKMRKENVLITEEMSEILDKIYEKNGTLNNAPIDKIIKTENKKVIKYVINKYEKIKLQYTDQTILKDKKITEAEKIKISLNTKNFIIKNKKYANYQMVTLFLSQTQEELEKLLEKEENIKEIVGLLPYVNLFKELTLQTLVEIIKTYEYVKNKNLTVYNKRKFIYENLDEIILISSGYYMVTEVAVNALTKKVIKELGETHIKKYLEFYLEMLEQKYTQIPPIELKYKDLILTSGNYDAERLLIGKIKTTKSSCIDLLNIGGKRTYKETLLKEDGDVILIKENDKLISRILVFRRGNTIQLISQQEQKQELELYRRIAQEIKIKSENDNIDCIVVNENSVKETNIAKLQNSKFINYFPHADTSDKVVVLYKNNKEINFIEEPKIRYKKARTKINYNPTELDIIRIKSLYMAKTNNTNIPNYEKYEKVILGEDWLIATAEDKIEQIMINPENEISQQEITTAKEYLENKQKI